jgi:hypothetical protein
MSVRRFEAKLRAHVKRRGPRIVAGVPSEFPRQRSEIREVRYFGIPQKRKFKRKETSG